MYVCIQYIKPNTQSYFTSNNKVESIRFHGMYFCLNVAFMYICVFVCMFERMHDVFVYFGQIKSN